MQISIANQLSGLNSRPLFYHGSRGCEAEVRWSAWLVSGEDSLPALEMATFLCVLSCFIFGGCVCIRKTEGVEEGEREREGGEHAPGSLPLLVKTVTPSIQGSPLQPPACVQEYSLGKNTGHALPCPYSRALPDPGINLRSLSSPALAGQYLTTVPPVKPN